jgi:hypothetical protein
MLAVLLAMLVHSNQEEEANKLRTGSNGAKLAVGGSAALAAEGG